MNDRDPFFQTNGLAMTTTATPTSLNSTDIVVTVDIETVTPAMASDWLESNSGNRRIDPPTVDRYARDMAAGNWMFTGESVKFDWSGRLIDSQHRLHAIVKAGRTVPMLVVRGLDPDVQRVVDSGRRRMTVQALAMAGHEHASIMSAAIKLILNYNAGKIQTSESGGLVEVSHSEALDFAASDPTIGWAAATSSQLERSIPGATPSVMAFSLWLTGRIDGPKSYEFHSDLAALRTNGPGDPRFTLLRRLGAIKDGKERVSQARMAFYFIRSWNAWRLGQPMSQLKSGNRAGPFPFPEPV